MLTFPEEILLLALDDSDGVIKDLPRLSSDTAIIASALLELTFMHRVDAGPEQLYVGDTSAVGDPLLDAVLAELAKEKGEKPIVYWLNLLTEHITNAESMVIDSLVKKGVLKVENKKILWVFEKRRYPVLNNHEIIEVTARLRDIIEHDVLPDPRDAVLISLVNACHLFREIFTEDEYDKYAPVIEKIAKFDFVGNALSDSIKDIEQTINMMNDAIFQYT